MAKIKERRLKNMHDRFAYNMSLRLAEQHIERRTILSEDRKYRYTLWRDGWDSLNDDCRERDNFVVFIGLNPSTADENKDDPTIRRCVGFAKAWEYDALCMMNLFAYRATDPRIMKSKDRPVGDENDKYISQICKSAGLVIAAWGVNGTFLGRNDEVRALVDGLQCLGKTKDGHPRHPLYVRGNVVPCAYD